MTRIFNSKTDLDLKSDNDPDVNFVLTNQTYQIDPNTGLHTKLEFACFRLSDQILGSGTQGIVHVGIYFMNLNVIPQKVAIKRVPLKRTIAPIQDCYANQEEPNKLTYNEAKILNQLDHPGIIKFIGFYCDYSYYYLITSYTPCKDLFTFVTDNDFKHLDKKHKHDIVYQIAKAIEYLHNNDVIHLDIKLENILIRNETNKVVLVDFAFSKEKINDDMPIATFSGSIAYADPDIIKMKAYNAKAADIWSFGVTIFSMFTKTNIFNLGDCDNYRLFVIKIMKNSPIDISYAELDDYKELLSKMLVYDSDQRLCIGEICTILESMTFD